MGELQFTGMLRLWKRLHQACCGNAAGEAAGGAEEAAEAAPASIQDAVLLLGLRSLGRRPGLPVAGQAPHHPHAAAARSRRLHLPEADRSARALEAHNMCGHQSHVDCATFALAV